MIEQGIEKTPISKDEWDSGRKWETPEARILLFLRKSRYVVVSTKGREKEISLTNLGKMILDYTTGFEV